LAVLTWKNFIGKIGNWHKHFLAKMIWKSDTESLDHVHHYGRSPLELIGMVSQFGLDTMHLVDKGVFGRF